MYSVLLALSRRQLASFVPAMALALCWLSFAGPARSLPREFEPRENGSLLLDDGSTYYPAPGTATQTAAELNDATRVNCDGTPCYSGTEAGDPDAIANSTAVEPDASTSTAAPGVQINPSSPAVVVPQPIHKAFHKDEGFGNSKFGGGYVFDASLDAIPATGTASAQLDAKADSKIIARLFSKENDVARAAVFAKSDENTTANSSFNVYVVGQQVYTHTLVPGTLAEYQVFNRQFFSTPTVTFSVFGYNVSVSGSVSGTAGARLTGTLSVAGPRLIFTPEGGAYGTASASVSLLGIVTLGVEGTLTLINIKEPTTLTLVATSCSDLDLALAADQQINTLSGKLKLFIKIKLLFIKKKKTWTITSWSGTTRTSNLFALAERPPFNFICSAAFRSAISASQAPPPPPPPPPPPIDDCGSKRGSYRAVCQ